MSIAVDLAGEVALVTGAGSGIGEAIANTLAKAGARVAVADLSGESATRVADAICSAGGKAIPLQMDIGDPSSIDTAISRLHSELGPISILVNNAGTWGVREFQETTPEEPDGR